MSIPTINPAILFTQVDDGYLAYDPCQDRLHRLNPVAALILELADGNRSIEQINGMIIPMLEEDAEEEIKNWFAQAVEEDLLELDVPKDQQTNVKIMSASELDELADKLMDEGKVQTAYICLKQAAELEPEKHRDLKNLWILCSVGGQE